MAKITRPNLNVLAFGSQTSGTGRTVFGSATQSDDLTDNLNTAFFEGWNTIGQKPPRQWENGAMFTISQLVSYLFQTGIAEWNVNQEYHKNSIAIGSNGNIYQSLSGNNTGNNPTTDSVNWISFASKYTLDINDLTAKTTPVDNDIFAIEDSEDSFSKKKLSFKDLKDNISSSLPSITGTASFTNSTNNINLTGLGDLEGLEIGDVIQISAAVNSGEFTIEDILDSNSVIVNEAHAGGATSKSLTNSTTGATIKLLCKWYNAPIGLGQGWVDVTGDRSEGATYTSPKNRAIQSMINLLESSNRARSTITVNGFAFLNSAYDNDATLSASANSFLILNSESTYRIDVVYGTIGKWLELR